MATKKEIKADLDSLGVEYPPDAFKSELEALLAAVLEPVTETSGGESAQSFEDVSGLCRQCNRPADHKHIGV